MKKYLFVASIVLGLTTSAQNISNKLTFKKGQKIELTSQIKITPEGGMGMAVDGNIVRAFDVEDANANTTKIEHKVKRVQFNIDLMGQTQSFDSEKEEDMKGPMGKAFEKSIKNKYSMIVDETGKVTAVTLDDDNPNKATTNSGNADMFANIFTQVTGSLDAPKIGDKTIFTILPSGNLSKGFTWTDTTNQAVSGKRNYTISDISENEILIDLKGENSINRTDETMGLQATISTKETTSGKIVLDRSTGLLKQEEVTIQSNGNISAQGQSFPLNNTITRKTSVKIL